jgi:hypothetical protein
MLKTNQYEDNATMTPNENLQESLVVALPTV